MARTAQSNLREYDIAGDKAYLLSVSLSRAFHNFILKIKGFDPEQTNFVHQAGWPAFRAFLRDCRKYYESEMKEGITFEEILDFEKSAYQKVWKDISEDEAQRIYRIARHLDENPALLG